MISDSDITAEKNDWDNLEPTQRVQVWIKNEEIAMHFNDLTMRLRQQALGGVGVLAVLAGGLFNHEGALEHRQLGWFLIAMAAVWFAIGILDQFYYQALLKGAVARLLRLEKYSPALRLSTDIEHAVGTTLGKLARLVFYGIVFLALIVGGGSLIWNAPSVGAKEPVVQATTIHVEPCPARPGAP